MKNFFITNCFMKGKQQLRLVAVEAPVLLQPTPAQRLHVFGSSPDVPGQRRLSQAQRQQPADKLSQQQLASV